MIAERINRMASSSSYSPRLYYTSQHEWGWQVAIDLFLAGMGSGGLITGILISWLGLSPYSTGTIFLWGPVTIAIGAFFLVLKLGIKGRFWRTMMNPKTSWLSRGFLILSGCIVFGMLALLISILPLFGVDIGSWSPGIRILEVIVLISAVAVAIYTGILVKSIRHVGFWNTPLLPVVFTISSLSTGTAATLLATNIYDLLVIGAGYSSDMGRVLMNTALVLMLIEAAVLIIYLYNRYMADEDQTKESVRLLLKGKLRFVFWLGIVTCGFVFPLILGAIYSVFPAHWYLLPAAGILFLPGHFYIRAGIIYAGVHNNPLYKLIELKNRGRLSGAGNSRTL